MENGPFEDVFPIENGDVPLLCYFTRGYLGCADRDEQSRAARMTIFPILNDKQMSNKVRVEHQPVIRIYWMVQTLTSIHEQEYDHFPFNFSNKGSQLVGGWLAPTRFKWYMRC